MEIHVLGNENEVTVPFSGTKSFSPRNLVIIRYQNAAGAFILGKIFTCFLPWNAGFYRKYSEYASFERNFRNYAHPMTMLHHVTCIWLMCVLHVKNQPDLPNRTQVIIDFPVWIYVPKFGDCESEKKWILDINSRHIDTNICF